MPFVFLTNLSNYTTSDGNFVIAFVIDITRRKGIENSIILQKEQLAEKNLKIEELNEDLEKKVELRTGQLQEAILHQQKEPGVLKCRYGSMKTMNGCRQTKLK